MEGFTVVVTKSTVPVGTGDEVEEIIRKTNPNAKFAVVSNPEFLREGAAINDFILALLIGIVSGTYSSIFVASPLLVDWQLYDDRKHGRIATTRAPRVRHTAV